MGCNNRRQPGVGTAFAIECAKRNMNLVLIALPYEQLKQTSEAISKQFSVNVIPSETDLSSEDACLAIFDFVEKKAVPVHMLINNAGIGSAGDFENISPAFCQLLVKVNVLSPVLLTRLFLPLLQQQPTAVSPLM
ncbi:SDR family NAD(P)-dependent oxidoreductase [Agriterribacter humi]|uniref:SDR family NAD(P)-dependent oxidoreductase n=1 Tax=Agriterribacter humi TaxID=1104781 RepID=UPI001D026937|nr:SDR family NAD(P)-dependent oxidoreductase [Agriterribacter humi]